jgi:hypothetical protein
MATPEARPELVAMPVRVEVARVAPRREAPDQEAPLAWSARAAALLPEAQPDRPPMPGPDAMPPCYQTNDTFQLGVSLYDGTSFGCPGNVTNGVFEIDGQVLSSDSSSLLLDSCPPNADCMPMASKFNFTAPGLLLSVPQEHSSRSD